eukprot:16435499-Heterocapsa_arctica.AAC.1
MAVICAIHGSSWGRDRTTMVESEGPAVDEESEVVWGVTRSNIDAHVPIRCLIVPPRIGLSGGLGAWCCESVSLGVRDGRFSCDGWVSLGDCLGVVRLSSVG